MITEKTIDMLTKDSVSIVTERYIEENGTRYKVGDIHRTTYVNSEADREALASSEPEDVSVAVLQFWGDQPTVFPSAPTTESEEE